MKTMTVIAMAILTACSADEPTAPVAETAPHVDTSALASHSLTVNSLPEMQLLATPHGREVLSRVVSCALPYGTSITAITQDGTPYSFRGSAGLAPGWAAHPPSAVEHQLVTACLQGRAPARTIASSAPMV